MEIKRVKTQVGKNLNQYLKNLEGKQARVGWLEKSRYQNGDYVAEIAAQNEFGNPSKHIPARPFFRPTISEKKTEWLKMAFNGSRSILQGKQTIDNVLELIAARASGQIKRKITQIYDPPLSRKTIESRIARSSGSTRLDKIQAQSLSKPLIDTGIMLGTLTYVVETEK